MNIVVYGHTDKRPIIYTLLKLCRSIGDTALVSTDRRFMRLIDNADSGEFAGMFISVSEYEPEEVFDTMGYSFDDFEFIIFDNVIPELYQKVIYVSGAKQDQDEIDMLEVLEEYETICLGYGNHCIPYTVQMFRNMEEMEAFKFLREVDKTTTKHVAKIMSPLVKIAEVNIRKVVAKK